MILLNWHERQVYLTLSEEDYLSFKVELESTYNKPFLVALLESIEGTCNYYRSEDSGTPRSFFERKISKEKTCYNIAIALEAIKAVIPTATFEDAKYVAMGYVPDVTKDYAHYKSEYGFYRRHGEKEDRSLVSKFRIGDFNYETLAQIETVCKCQSFSGFIPEKRLQKVKLALFYGLIKREELSEYLDNLIYGQVVQQKENNNEQ